MTVSEPPTTGSGLGSWWWPIYTGTIAGAVIGLYATTGHFGAGVVGGCLVVTGCVIGQLYPPRERHDD